MKDSLKNWRGTAIVFGVDWGDSGKGRLVDDLSQNANIIARYNGGSNTGHTVENEKGKFAFHIMPSGIFNQKALCLVGRGVAVNLEVLILEMDSLKKAGVSFKKLIIDEQAPLTMPWHILRDGIREKIRKSKIGTTGNGVGPTFADATERVGLKVKDLISKDLRSKIYQEAEVQNKFYGLNISKDTVYLRFSKLAKMVKPYIAKTTNILNEAHKKNQNILFEGAQGYFLDIDAGTYPFVTSSNPGVVGVWRSFDFHPQNINHVIGITKAYTTRVGSGPMPTTMEEKTAAEIIEKGHEIGTTTGRIRTPGWLDTVLIKYANQSNRLTSLAITKLDVLSGQKKIKLCVGYNLSGKSVNYTPHDAATLAQVKPEYIEFEGWSQDISSVRNFSKLPQNAKKYVNAIEKITGIPVKFISVGPKRGEVIYV
jgi:adenylosuccinate synthase